MNQDKYNRKKKRARSARRQYLGTLSTKSVDIKGISTTDVANTIDHEAMAEGKMLPSHFSRTHSYNFNMYEGIKNNKSDLTVGPACYEKEPLIGNPSNSVF